MTKVRIAGCGKILEADEGDDLLRALQAARHPISTSCGGRASCGLCRLTVVEGAELLTPLGPEEIVHLGNVARLIGARLACQARVCGEGELSVDVPQVDNVELRKRAKAERMTRQRLEGSTPTPSPAALSSQPRAAERPGKIEWRPRKLEGSGVAPRPGEAGPAPGPAPGPGPRGADPRGSPSRGSRGGGKAGGRGGEGPGSTGGG